MTILARKLVSSYQKLRHDLSSTPIRAYKGYAGTWKNLRRLQNPNIVEQKPTEDWASKGELKKTTLVYVCGLGATGSLGLQHYYKPEVKQVEELKRGEIGTSTFRRLHGLSRSDRVVSIACGYGFTLMALRAHGSSQSAIGFGLNTHSQLGYQASRPGFPLEILATPGSIWLPTESLVTKVSCGRGHSLLLTEDKKVFSLGNNSFGQCGRPINEKENYFGSKMVHQLEDLPSNISQIICGQDHSMFLTEDGELYTCGWGADGQTGLGHYDNQWKPGQVCGDIEKVKLVKVSSSADTVLALDDQGNVFGWGNTEYAQFRTLANIEQEQFNTPRYLKLNSIPGKIVDIAAGGTICAILNDCGQVFVWGFGILGKGPNVSHSSKPTLIPESLFGRNIYNPETKVKKIYAGLSHFAAISDVGDLYTWGKNRGGNLGFVHSNDQYFPMRVNMQLSAVKKVSLGVDHTCAIVEKMC